MKQNDNFLTPFPASLQVKLTRGLNPLLMKLSIVKCPLSLIFALALFALAPHAAQAQTFTFSKNLDPFYTVIEGHNIQLTINATVTPSATPSYQWYIDNGGSATAVTNGGVYSGATSNTLTLTKAPATLNGNKYFCRVSASGRTADSKTTTLTITPAVGFKVTLDPVGATYTQSTVVYATMLTARFEYKSSEGFIDTNKPYKMQWFWSNTNSNTGRSNGQGESIYNFHDENAINQITTYTPPIHVAGIRYYYAVVTYTILPCRA